MHKENAMWSVYTLSDSRNVPDIRYVGITNNLKRRLSNHKSDAATNHRTNWIRSVGRDGGEIVMNVVFSGLTAEDANKHERKLISDLAGLGYRLVNGTAGGSGLLNPPRHVRDKISLALKGRKKSDQHVRNLSASLSSVMSSKDVRGRLSTSGVTAWGDPDKRARMSMAMRGKEISTAHRESIASSLRGHPPRGGAQFKGVSKNGSGWLARLWAGGSSQSLGTHRSIEDAARAYDQAAHAAWGKDCYLNFPEEHYGTRS